MEPLYTVVIILELAAVFVGMVSENMFSSVLSPYEQKKLQSGLNAVQIARELLNNHNCSDVNIELSESKFSALYDDANRVLKINSSVYGSGSITSVSLVTLECCHAIRGRSSTFWGRLHPVMRWFARFSHWIYLPVLFAAFVTESIAVLIAGTAVFLTTAFLVVVSLPGEFAAARRTMIVLQDGGYVTEKELAGVKEVLSVAKYTYVMHATSFLFLMLTFWLKAYIRTEIKSAKRRRK